MQNRYLPFDTLNAAFNLRIAQIFAFNQDRLHTIPDGTHYESLYLLQKTLEADQLITIEEKSKILTGRLLQAAKEIDSEPMTEMVKQFGPSHIRKTIDVVLGISEGANYDEETKEEAAEALKKFEKTRTEEAAWEQCFKRKNANTGGVASLGLMGGQGRQQQQQLVDSQKEQEKKAPSPNYSSFN